jgi:hypothetical protein
MIINEIKHGQGLGNQLFCYVTTRCIAKDNGYDFGFLGTENLGDPRFNSKGLYFMDLDLGKEAVDVENTYTEKSKRIKLNTCHHDMTHGCDISLYDPDLAKVKDNTLIQGIMQDEKYFYHHLDSIKEWLKVKPEYDTYEYHQDDICIMNFRGGEYRSLHELYLTRDYWVNAIKHMMNINPEMDFRIVTEDVSAANAMFPEIEAYHFDIAKDYSIIKNAKYLILSNSTFGCFPAFTSETVEYVIAPKYWARHNVSDGYWATGQNLYQNWMWQDREGLLFDYEQCYNEFEKYKVESGIYA